MRDVQYRSAGRSDLGKVREHNEDSLLVDDELGLYVVADGVGGHAAGEVASALAVEAAAADVRAWAEGGRKSPLVDAARQAVEAACKAVHERATSDPAVRGMSTTMTLLLVDDRHAAMAHVGDSRLYLVRRGRLDQLSADQTIAAELGRAGAIPKDKVESHPYAHVLTQSLGSQPSVMPDTLMMELLPDDVLVLATDGLNAVARDPVEFVGLLAGTEEQAADHMVAAANAAGGRDNISVIVIRSVLPGTTPGESFPDLARPAPLFRGISTAGLFRISESGDVRSVGAGDQLLTQGEEADHLIVVLDGELEWTVGGSSRRLRSGDAMGVSAVLRPRPSPGTLTAVSASRILCLDAKELDRLARRRKRLGNAVLRALAKRLADTIVAGDDQLALSGF